MTHLEARAEAIRALSALLRAGAAPRDALVVWHDHAPQASRSALRRVARRLRLGDDVGHAVLGSMDFLQEDAGVLAGVLSAHRDAGGDLARVLDELALAIERRREALMTARASGAGAKASARLVAGLPLGFIPLMPLSRAPLFDAAGLLLLTLGLGLALGGITWIDKLYPAPPATDDGVAVVADLVSSMLRGGVGLVAAVETVVDHAPPDVRSDMERARRLVRLGATWAAAFGRANIDALRALGVTLDRTRSLGVPAADALEVFAAQRRAQRAREFEVATRRAPVLMVVPLVVCVLPSFVLLGLAPFLRSVSLGG